jgi:hypothetical protein
MKVSESKFSWKAGDITTHPASPEEIAKVEEARRKAREDLKKRQDEQAPSS